MTKYIMIMTIGLIGSQAYAEESQDSRKDDCRPGKVFIEDIDLTSEQKGLVKELRAVKKEHRFEKGTKKHPRLKRLETMIAFVEGDLSREDIHLEVDQSHNDKTAGHSNMQASLFDLLDSYSSEQLDQVSTNIENTKECKNKYSKPSKKGKGGPKGKALFKGLELSDSQQGLLDELHRARKEGKENPHKGFRSEQKESLEGFIAGDLSRKDIDKMFKEKSEERLESRHERADLMMNFLETLSEEQKDTFVVNAEEVQMKTKEKREEHRQHSEKE